MTGELQKPKARRHTGTRVAPTRRRQASSEWTVDDPDPVSIREVEATLYAKTQRLVVIAAIVIAILWVVFGFISSMTPMYAQAREVLREVKEVLLVLTGGIVVYYFSRR